MKYTITQMFAYSLLVIFILLYPVYMIIHVLDYMFYNGWNYIIDNCGS